MPPRPLAASMKSTRVVARRVMLILFNPKVTRPKNRRFPLSVLALAAVLEGREEYEIVDGNIDADPLKTIEGIAAAKPLEMLGVSLMLGSQMVEAIALLKQFRARKPKLTIVCGG